MAGRKTYYDLLEVGPDASTTEIAGAFREKLGEVRRRADVAPEYMATLNEAYQTLANPARRSAYDASLAPPKPRAAVAVDDDLPADGMSPWVKFGAPLAIGIVVFLGWRSHRKPEPMPVRVVTTTVVSGNDAQAAPATFTPFSQPAVRSPEPAARPATPNALSAQQLFAQNSRSVVSIMAGDATGPISQGSGVVTGSREVITNCHVVKGTTKVMVKTGGAMLPAKVSVADEEFDLCSLEVPGLDAPSVNVAGTGDVQTGSRVYAIGSPKGLELTISEGIVSSLRETKEGTIIQTTAPVSPGSSGGGLFDDQGRLVGIVTFQRRDGQNLNFAVPADWIAQMRTRGSGITTVAATASRDPSVQEMVVGRWHCHAPIGGSNWEFEYSADGVLRITWNDGHSGAGRYTIAGRRINYFGDKGLTFDIESITEDRMVQFASFGDRLACDRK